MTLALDFGTTSVKAIIAGDEGRLRFFSFNLGFRTPIFSRDSLSRTLGILENLSGEKLFADGKKLTRLYACLGLPVYETVGFLDQPMLLTGQALSALGLNVLDVGAQFVHFKERVSISPIDAEEVLRWLPFKAESVEVLNFIENKKIYGSILPATPRDLFFEQAVARVRVAEMFQSQRIEDDLSEIYLSGAVFSKAPYPEQALLLALDALQPKGMIKIWLDQNQILPVSGLLKHYAAQDFTRLGEEFNPIFLATVITLLDSSEIEIDLGLRSGVQEVSLKIGDLYAFPLKLGERALVKIKGLSSQGEFREHEVVGGSAGLIFDLRGRPLKIPESPSLRHELLTLWDRSLGASGQLERID